MSTVMLNVTFTSYTLVTIQFAILLLFALTEPWIAQNALALVLEVLGRVLGLWSI